MRCVVFPFDLIDPRAAMYDLGTTLDVDELVALIDTWIGELDAP